MVSIPRAPPAVAPEAESSAQVAMRAELQSIREKRDRLRGELVDARVEVADYKELQRELAQTRAQAANLDREIARLSAALDRTRAKARKSPIPRFSSRKRLFGLAQSYAALQLPSVTGCWFYVYVPFS
ncbi:hypothetical protein CDL15_Pgr026986 [Punica granatum]|nr:hypothetical protein CDL15_Pgr026986 [Punica granatum]